MIDLANFHFIRPAWLLALLPWLWLLIQIKRNTLQQGRWASVCDKELLPYILQQRATESHTGTLLALFLASLLSIIALAGPSWQRLPMPVFRNDAALVIALNLSETMNATDIKPSRLIRARYKIADILRQRKDGQTALLVYAGDAFTVTPLTDDIETILNQLNALRTDIMPTPGRNTPAAIRLARQLIKQAGLPKGDILLVTDGVEATAFDAVPALLDNDTMSVLAVGTADGAPIKLPQGGFAKDAQGNILVPKLEIESLVKLANKGGGVCVTLTPDDRDIKTLLATFETHQKTEQNKPGNLQLELWQDAGPYLLWMIVPLAALAFRKGLLVLAFLVLLPFPKSSYAFDAASVWQNLWKTPDQQAQQAFQQQQFEKASQKFQNPAWKAAAEYRAGHYEQAARLWQQLDTAQAHYNRGNALAKAGQLKQAIKAYDKALKLQPDFADAKYNKALLEKQLQQQQQKQSEKNQSSQENSEQQKQSDKQQDKPQQSSDSGQQDSKQNKAGDKQDQTSADNQQNNAAEQEQVQSAKQKPEPQPVDSATDSKQPSEKADAAKAHAAELSDEEQQAMEQWLQRIPDDPAGLLKRKFRYQYQQRQNRR